MPPSENSVTPQNALTAADWDARYAGRDTPWDIGAVSPPLVSFHASGILPAGRRVLIPGCGSGHEVRFLANAGFDAVGADYSPAAVEQSRTLIEGTPRAAVICADLLGAPPSGVARFDWAFDQTFFCAILPGQRPQYAIAMKQWLLEGGELWALSFRVPSPGGPPFDSTPEEYIALMTGAGFDLIEKRALDAESHPARRGRESLVRLIAK